MNDDELRNLLHGAVRDVTPRSRIDELLAQQPPRRNRATAVIGIAAALVLVVAIAVLVSRSGSPETVVTTDPSTTTTSAPSPPRVGDQISVEEDALPAGLRLLEEGPRRTGAELTVESRFAAEDGAWNGDGPYVRIIYDRGQALGTNFLAAERGDPDLEIAGDPAWWSRESLPIVQGDLAAMQNAWITLDWSPGPDELVRIQSKGVSIEDIQTIAESVVLDG